MSHIRELRLYILPATVFLAAMPALAHAAPLKKEIVEEALAQTLALDPAKQDVLDVTQVGDDLLLTINRDAFLSQSGMNLFSRYLPTQFKLKLSDKAGYAFLSQDPKEAYTSETAIGKDAGTTTVGDLDIRGVVPFGLTGHAVLAMALKKIAYKSKDGSHETSVGAATLNAYRNQMLFGPTTLQVGYQLKDVSEKAISADGYPFELGMDGMHYTLLIGRTDTTPVSSALWKGEPFMRAVFPDDGSTLRTIVSKALGFETSYSASDINYSGYPLSFHLQNLSLKYQSKGNGGSAGRFDIGLDYPFIRDMPIGFVLGEFLPEHVWFSGEIGEIDYHDLFTSKNAVLNPFSAEFQFAPDYRKLKSFKIPTLKFAGFDQQSDFTGSGTLALRNDGRPLLSGMITLRLKKGSEQFKDMLSRNSNDLETEMLRYRLRKAFATARQEADGTLSFDIVLKDNAISVNGKPIWQ